MSLKKRIYAIIILVAVLAGVFYVGKSGIQLSQEEQKESFLKNSKKKDTLQFWYTDEALTDYLNAAAVSYYETYGTRVELTLMPQTEVLEAINAATLDDEVQTPDLYMITNDSLEKAYLAGLAVGYWKDLEDIRKNWTVDREFDALISEEETEKKVKGWKKAVACARFWAEE